MSAAARMFILASAPTIDRLRREAPCRALTEPGGVAVLPLEGLHQGQESDGIERNRALFESASARGVRPAVALCEIVREGDLADFVEKLRHAAATLRDALQRDRMPFPLNAVILVGRALLNEADVAALELLGSGSPKPLEKAAAADKRPEADPLRDLVPFDVPIYLFLGRSRLDHASQSWDAAATWPVSVSRLLASIEASPSRTGGLRTCRSVAVTLGSADASGLEREVLTLVRWSLSADAPLSGSDHAAPEPGRTRNDLTPDDPPNDAVDASGAPRHRLDQHGRSRAAHPELPSFWEFEPALDRTDLSTGGATRQSQTRLDDSRESEWQLRRAERGRIFMRDRVRRALAAVYTFAGPRSILRRVWQRIHSHPEHLAWHASGGFVRLGERRELSLVMDQLRGWRAIEQLDGEAREAREVAMAQAAELDRARSRFVGLGWRLAAITCAGLFSAAIVGTAVAPFGPRWVLYTGIGTALAAILAAAAVLLGELWAARRGRALLERSVLHAESCIARAYAARLALGSDGELLQRSMAWLQSAARVRDAARRLLELQTIALERALQGHAPLRTANLTTADDYARQSSVVTNLGLASLRASAELLKREPDFVAQLQSDFRMWWSDAMRSHDPDEVGSVSATKFRPRLESVLRELQLKSRRRLLRFIEQREDRAWIDEAQRDLCRLLGVGSDLPGLGVKTERARGLRLNRSMLAVASGPAMLGAVRGALQTTALDAATVHELQHDLEPWGLSGLALDEITISVRRDSPDEPVRFIEGLDIQRNRGGT
jgi:hypothetical protein